MSATQGLLLAAALAAAVALLVLARRGMGRDWETARQADAGVVEEYCRLVATERYREAWERCLSSGRRSASDAASFEAAHRKRRADVGALQGRRLLRVDASRNLFSRERRLVLQYELTYAGRTEPRALVVDDADGTFLVDGTYTSGAGETLDAFLW